MNYDIFNGDADGIIALLQLRQHNPIDSQLVTGVKRDIKLIDKLKITADDQLTVLDISMEKNIDALNKVLELGAEVFYADHHRSGDIPLHQNLNAHIDLDANTCTALIIDKVLEGKYHHWAITAAYGDNLIAAADGLAKAAGLTLEQASLLKELGTLINYNGYGSDITDLHYPPAVLYSELLKYESPFDVIFDQSSPFHILRDAYSRDMNLAISIFPMYKSRKLFVVELPDKAWSRRISGVYGNALANESPDTAHAVLTKNSDGKTFTVSLRAPINQKHSAGDICSRFETGGGREAAAGINKLQISELNEFYCIVEASY